MQRELRLHEDVGGSADPGQPFADRTAVLAVVIELRRPDAAGAVIVPRMEEGRGIDTMGRAVIDRADWDGPPSPLAVGRRARGDVGEADLGLDGVVEIAIRPLLIRRRRVVRYH